MQNNRVHVGDGDVDHKEKLMASMKDKGYGNLGEFYRILIRRYFAS
jgi:hypothetical protein